MDTLILDDDGDIVVRESVVHCGQVDKRSHHSRNDLRAPRLRTRNRHDDSEVTGRDAHVTMASLAALNRGSTLSLGGG